MNSLCVPGKLLSVLHAFHLILTITIRGGDIINTTLQMRKLRFTKVEVIELEHDRAGILTETFLTLRPAFSATMLSSCHDHQVLYLTDRRNEEQDLDKGSGNRHKIFMERLKLDMCQSKSWSKSFYSSFFEARTGF